MMWIKIAMSLVQILLVLLAAPFVAGLVRFVKARLQGRHGASPFLVYTTLLTLLKKRMMISASVSWVFRAVPFVVLGSTLFLVAVLPLVFSGSSLAGLSDFFVIAGVLLLGSIFLVLGGMDAGSAFGNMGASREMTLASLVEPALLTIFAGLAYLSGSMTVDGMFGQLNIITEPQVLFLLVAFILVTLAENARYPVDNPATHLELTMVHEAMLLEYSGRYLALLEYASAIKLTIFALLLANFIFPAFSLANSFGFSTFVLAIIVTLVKLIIFATLLACLESSIVKMRFYRMSEYLSIAFIIAFCGLVLSIVLNLGGGSFANYTVYAALAVFFVVLLFGRLRLKAIVAYYALSSLAIAGLAFSLAQLIPAEKNHLLIFAISTIVIKCLAVPYIIKLAERRQRQTASLESFLRPAASYFLAILLLAVVFFIIYQSGITATMEFGALIYSAVALFVLGLATMLIHRNVFSQIIALLVLENGIAIFTLATVRSLPLYIEAGVFFVTITTALVLSLLSSRVKGLYGSVDTDQLRNLTEQS